jgi:hypothetical protein
MADGIISREPRMTPCMAKLDRLGWEVGFTFQAYGARIGVRSNDPELLEMLRRQLPPGAQDDPGRKLVDVLFSARRASLGSRPGVRNFHLLYHSIARVARTTELDEVAATFGDQIHLVVAAHARRYVFIHAGCAGWGGRAIVVPGRTLTGKSTLVTALVKAGADYLSDEYAVIDSRGRVRPYPRAISLRGKSGAKPRLVTAEELGGRTGRKPLPLGLVASLAYAPKAKGRLRPLSPGEAAMELLANAVAVRRHPGRTLAYVQRATAGARGVKGKRGGAQAMVPRLLRLV